MENLIRTKYKKYEVDSHQCLLNILDRVTPETVIGRDYKNNRTVCSDLYGRVATMYYNPRHDSLIVMIVASSDWSKEEEHNVTNSKNTYIPGLYLG